MRTRLPLKAALLLFPVFLGSPRCLHAQERPPFTLEQIEELLAAGLAPSVIVEMAGADCLAFRLNEEAEGRLRAAGATDELITGLRNVCYGGPEPEPETPTETPPVAASSSIPLPYSPGSAALRSLAIPGLGQFYTGRPAVGALFLAGWAGALGFGFMSQDVTVECLARVGESEPCPSDQVRGKVTERPMLVLGLGAAVAVAVISAIEARSGADKANARQMALGQGAGGRNLLLEIFPPPASASGQRLVLLQLRHR
jgi:TM2 domain-containing membrane protein YozV